MLPFASLCRPHWGLIICQVQSRCLNVKLPKYHVVFSASLPFLASVDCILHCLGTQGSFVQAGLPVFIYLLNPFLSTPSLHCWGPPPPNSLALLLHHADLHLWKKRLPVAERLVFTPPFYRLPAILLRYRLTFPSLWREWPFPWSWASFQYLLTSFFLDRKTKLFLLKHSYNPIFHLSTELIFNSPT